jgi:hypothetical protein
MGSETEGCMDGGECTGVVWTGGRVKGNERGGSVMHGDRE